jgi:AraC family transcriptional regulator, chitin signaling transcriptional activator
VKEIFRCIWLIVFAVLSAKGQTASEKGVPFIHNVTPEQYLNKGKVWDISSSPNGLIYMAADGGLLEFDGQRWLHYKGSKGFTRSVLVDSDSILFTGSDLDFGIWRRNVFREMEYTSLYPFREEANAENEEFWHIVKMADKYCFLSGLNFYVYYKEQITRMAAPFRFTGRAIVGDYLYLSDAREGLFVFDGLLLKKIADFPKGTALRIIGGYLYGDDPTFVTSDQGIWRYAAGQWIRVEHAAAKRLQEAKVFCFQELAGGKLAFGTVLQGLFITDQDGRIIHHINKQKGLLNNTVLSLHQTPTGILWLGMDYGTASLDLESCVTYVDDIRGEFGSAQTAMLRNGQLYVGTNQGLYRTSWDSLSNRFPLPKMNRVTGTEGQVWTLARVGSDFFMGHDRGLFLAEGDTWTRMGPEQGVWTILPFKDGFLAGTYQGISFYTRLNGRWQFQQKLDEVFGSCNQIFSQGDSILWTAIPNFGIVRAFVDPDLRIKGKEIYASALFEEEEWRLSMDGQRALVRTPKFTFEFDASASTFVKRDSSSVLPWRKAALSPPFSFAVALDDRFEFHPRFNGFSLKKRTCPVEDTLKVPFAIQWRRIWSFNNETYERIAPGDKLAYSKNNLRVEVAVPGATNPRFEWRLREKDSWSSLSEDPVVTILDLPAGVHRIQIRALVNNMYTEPMVIVVRVAAPLLLSWPFWIVWALLAGLVVILLRKRQRRALRKQQEALLSRKKQALEDQEAAHRREIEALTREAVERENEWLKEQLKNKTVELATKAKENDDKNRLLLALKEKMDEPGPGPQKDKMRIVEMKSLLDRYMKVEDKTFEIQMDDLHQEFFKKMRERFPGLSGNDLRLCAYLKIGLNSKEMADLLNVQPSSLYISRSRLRRKLNLSPDEDLSTFLNNL